MGCAPHDGSLTWRSGVCRELWTRNLARTRLGAMNARELRRCWSDPAKERRQRSAPARDRRQVECGVGFAQETCTNPQHSVVDLDVFRQVRVRCAGDSERCRSYLFVAPNLASPQCSCFRIAFFHLLAKVHNYFFWEESQVQCKHDIMALVGHAFVTISEHEKTFRSNPFGEHCWQESHQSKTY